jgi:hypothetical protein
LGSSLQALVPSGQATPNSEKKKVEKSMIATFIKQELTAAVI